MIYLKQWGKQRTGTNFTKAVTELNFPDTHTFSSILGWKHGPYINPHAWLSKQPAGEINTGVKTGWYKKDLEMISSNNIIYNTVTVRNPFSFIESFTRYKGKSPDKPEFVLNALKDYIRCYNSWFNNLARNPDLWVVFIYEDLIQEPKPVLDSLSKTIGAVKKDEYELPSKRLFRGHDKSGTVYLRKPFDSTKFLDRSYLRKLNKKTRQRIMDETETLRKRLKPFMTEDTHNKFYQL